MHRTNPACLLVIGVFLIGVLVLAACSAPPAGLGIALDAPAIELLRGTEAAVSVSVTGSGADPAPLSISGLPANVTATFAPPTVMAGATTSVLTLSAAPAASEGPTAVTVTVTQGTRAASTDLTITVSSLTVNGTVFGLLGDPVAGVGVAIGSSIASTDAAGAFTIAGVAVPYDVTLYSAAGAWGHVFEGMTSASPELLPLGVINDTGYAEGTIEGSLPAVVPVDSGAIVCAEGLGAVVLGCGTVSSGATDYTFTVLLPGNGTAGVRLHALLSAQDVDGNPTSFTAYGTATGTATANVTTTIDIPASVATATANLPIALSLPAAYTPSFLTASVRLSPAATVPARDAYVAFPANVSIPVPVIGEGSYNVIAAAEAADGSATYGWVSGATVATGAAMTLPAPVVQVAPADGASGVTTGTTFSIASAAGAAHTFVFSPNVAGDPVFAVTTMSDTATIPNLNAFGLAVPGSAPYSWAILEAATATTSAAAGVGWIGHYYAAVIGTQLGGTPVDTTGSITVSTNRSFTTN